MTRQQAPYRGEFRARAVTYERDGPQAVRIEQRYDRPPFASRFERPGGRALPGPAPEDREAVPIRPTVIRTHRLTLTGELGHDSAPALEAAIDTLCDSGIDELVLDLGGLAAIDATGVQVLAMRCAICNKRGVRVLLERVDAAVQQGLAAAIGPAAADALMRML
jgi:anti-anti-sigma factor